MPRSWYFVINPKALNWPAPAGERAEEFDLDAAEGFFEMGKAMPFASEAITVIFNTFKVKDPTAGFLGSLNRLPN